MVRTMLADFRRVKARYFLATFFTLVLGTAGLMTVWCVLARVGESYGYLDEEPWVHLMSENRRYAFRVPPSTDLLEDWRLRLGSYDRLTGFLIHEAAVRAGESSRTLTCASVDPHLLELLDLTPEVGRSFDTSNPIAETSVVLVAAGLARRVYGDPEAAIGKTLFLDGEPQQVIGILPKTFGNRLSPGDAIAVVLPIRYPQHESVQVIARLRPGVTVSEAQAELDAWATVQPPSLTQNGEVHWVILTRSDLMDSRTLKMFQIAIAAAVILLLVTISTVAHLIGAQMEAQRRELATRWAVGATRWNLLWFKLRSAIATAGLASVAGALLASWALRVITASLPSHLRFLQGVQVELPALFAALLLNLLTVLIFAVQPVLFRSRRQIGRDLTSDRILGTRSSPVRLFDHAHIVTVVACALVLILVTYLAAGTVANLSRAEPGFDEAGLLSIKVQLPAWKFGDSASRAAALAPLLEGLIADPVVESAGFSDQPPSQPGVFLGHVEHSGEGGEREIPSPVGLIFIGTSYFQTLDQEILAGRGFFESEVHAGAPVVVISRAVSKLMAPDPRSVLGESIRFGDETRRIVGVVSDIRTPGLATSLNHLQVYWPLAKYRNSMTVLARLRGAVALDLGSLRGRLDPDIVVEAEPMEAVMAESTAEIRFLASLFALMAGLSGFLSFFGIYSIMSDFADRQRRQIALRMAMGADPGTVKRWVMWKGLSRSLIGVAAGLAASYPAARLLDSHLFQIEPENTPARLVAALLVVGVTFVATWVPAARAARTPPVQALADS